ncbi:MAG TPA: hypothetical protein VF068_12155 [Rubrobacter sp.]
MKQEVAGSTIDDSDAVSGINSGGAAGVFGQTNEPTRGAVEGSNITDGGRGVWGNAN